MNDLHFPVRQSVKIRILRQFVMAMVNAGKSKTMKTRYANLILSLDFTCRNQLQQTLRVCRFWQVCISSNLLPLR